MYLKLDNKLVLNINQLDISQYLKNSSSKKAFDINSITDNIKYGIWTISYFQKLMIKKIILDKTTNASVIYDGKEYKIFFPNFKADFTIEDNQRDIKLNIIDFEFLHLNLKNGYILYSPSSKKLGFNLMVLPNNTKNTEIYLQGITDFKTLEMRAKTSEIKDISFLKPYFDDIENNELKKWIFDKIKFSSLQIKSADFKTTLKKKVFLNDLMKNSKLDIVIKEPRIFLEDNLEPIIAQNANINLKQEKLYINLNTPTYGNINLDGSKLIFSNFDDSLKMDISIISKEAQYTKELKDLLQDYHIELPIDKLGSSADVNLKLDLQFLQDAEPLVSVKGVIVTDDANFNLYNIPLYTKNANISLDITPEYKYVYIDTLHTRYENIADVDTNIVLNLMDDNLRVDATIHKLQVSTNNDINTMPYQKKHIKQEDSLPKEMTSQYLEPSSKNVEENSKQNFAPNEAQSLQAKSEATDNNSLEDPSKNYSQQDQQAVAQENIKEQENQENIDMNTKISQNMQENQEENDNLKPVTKTTKQKISKQVYYKNLSPQELQRQIINAIKKQNEEKFTKDIIYATNTILPKLSLNLDFSDPNSINLSIPDLSIEGKIINNKYTFKINNLSQFYPYSPLMQYIGVKEGNISLSTSDFNHIDFALNLSGLTLPLYNKDNQKITQIAILGKVSGDNIEASTPNDEIKLNTKDNQTHVTLKNLDFNLNEFFESKIPAIEEIFKNSNNAKLTQAQIDDETYFIREKQKYEFIHHIKAPKIILESSNPIVTYKDYQIPLDNVNLRFRDGRVNADGTYKNGILNFDIIHSDILVKASNFSGKFIREVLKTKMIQGGLYTLIGAYKDGSFNGELKVQNTTIKDFVVLQNVINLIDTIPSLIVFKNPNLGVDGYEITKGNILFAINSKYIGFEKIDLIGSSMDVNGNGIIELGSDQLNLNLKISTIKNLTNILSKIPLVGYLILGKDGKISTNVVVNGTLDDPKTQISLAEDAIKAPINILRRVFTPIDIIVDEIKKEMK